MRYGEHEESIDNINPNANRTTPIPIDKIAPANLTIISIKTEVRLIEFLSPPPFIVGGPSKKRFKL